jgi:regulator of cell morphogenesis and NO signaling
MAESRTLTIREILRGRPAAVKALEKAGGPACWRHLDQTLAEFCDDLSLEADRLAGEIEALPESDEPADSPLWASRPLFEVVDRLTVDHARFREKAIPELEALVRPAEGGSAVGASLGAEEKSFLAEARRDIESFRVDLLLHMEEEEGYLFPKALRTEACLRFPELSPEIFRGSIDAYPENLLHTPEEKLKAVMRALRERVGDLARRHRVPAQAAPLEARLAEMEERIAAHADLETRVLVPRALEMEKRLVRRVRRSGESIE